MLEVLLKVKPGLITVQTEIDYSYDRLNEPDWVLVAKVAAYLVPFAELMKQGSSETACISDTIPYVKYLQFKLQKLPRSGVCRMRKALIEETERYFRGLDRRDHLPSIEDCDVFTFATLLDPRYKRHGFNSSLKAGFAVEGLRKVLSKVNLQSNSSVEEPHTANATQEPQCSSTSASDDWDICMGVDDPEIDVQIDEQDDELSAYLDEKNIAITGSPFRLVERERRKVPKTFFLARKYLCSPMSSVASERELKLAKRIHQDRLRVKPDTVERMLFIKYNLRFLDYKN